MDPAKDIRTPLGSVSLQYSDLIRCALTCKEVSGLLSLVADIYSIGDERYKWRHSSGKFGSLYCKAIPSRSQRKESDTSCFFCLGCVLLYEMGAYSDVIFSPKP